MTIKKQNEVDAATIKQLNQRLGRKTSYGVAATMCFDPHFGIVYYNKRKVVRNVLVCMSCNGLRADIEIPAQKQKKVGQGDKAYYLGDGMSKPFRQYLNGLLKKYNFSHPSKGFNFDWRHAALSRNSNPFVNETLKFTNCIFIFIYHGQWSTSIN